MGIFKTIAGIGLLSSFLKHMRPMTRIQYGEEAVKLRFGSPVRRRRDGYDKKRGCYYSKGDEVILGPGLHPLFPLMHHVEVINVKEKTRRFDDRMEVAMQDGIICRVRAVVRFQVADTFKALFEVDNFFESVTYWSETILYEVLHGKEYFKLESLEQVSEDIRARIEKETESWGVQVNYFRISSLEPTENSQQAIGIQAKVSQLNAEIPNLDEVVKEVGPLMVASLLGGGILGSVNAEMPEAPAADQGLAAVHDLGAPIRGHASNGNGIRARAESAVRGALTK